MPVRELLLAAYDGVGLAPPSCCLDEAHATAKIAVGEVGRAGSFDLTDRLQRARLARS